MESYCRTSFRERVEMNALRGQGLSLSEIARQIGRSKSTVWREFQRFPFTYEPEKAELQAQFKARHRRRWKEKLSRNPKLLSEVHSRLRKKWSPKQISITLQRDFPGDEEMRVSHETIYTYVYVLPRGALRVELLACLRQRRKSRHRRKPSGDYRGKITDMISIEERPKEVADRSLAGHWEGDILMGKRHKTMIGTLVERKTRALLLVPLKNKSAPEVRRSFEKALKDLPRKMRKTLTYDQGHEMAEHKLFTKNTKIKVYFCHPASPWERGTCENTNGLIRQYFPKGTDFSKVTKRELKRVQDELNERPRATLDYLTPKDIFEKEVLSVVPLKT